MLAAGQNRESWHCLGGIHPSSPHFFAYWKMCFWMTAFLVSWDISRLRQSSWTNMQPRKKQTSCQTFCGNYYWNVIFPKRLSDEWVLKLFRLAYNRLFHVSKLSMERIAHRCRETCRQVECHGKKNQSFLGKYRTQTWTIQPLQLACNIVMIRIQLQNLRSPKTSRAGDVELYLRNLFGQKCNGTPLNWGE